MKIQKKIVGGRFGGGGGVRVGDGQGGCERGIEVFVKIQKKNRGVTVGVFGFGGQGECNREVKFL